MRRTYAFDIWQEWVAEAHALHSTSQHLDLPAEERSAVCRAAIVAISAAFEAYVEAIAEASGTAREHPRRHIDAALAGFHNPRPEHVDALLCDCGWAAEDVEDAWHEIDRQLGGRRGSVREDIDSHQDDRHSVAHGREWVSISSEEVVDRIGVFADVVAALDGVAGRVVEEQTDRAIWAAPDAQEVQNGSAS